MLLSFLINVAIASAASVDVTVVDSSGAPLKDVLVILQALDSTVRYADHFQITRDGPAGRVWMPVSTG